MAEWSGSSRLDLEAEDVTAGSILESVYWNKIGPADAIREMERHSRNRAKELREAAAAVTHRPEQAGNYRERAEAHEHEAATWSLLWHLSSGREDMDNELEELEMRLMEKAPGNHLPLSGRLRKAALGQAGEVRRLNETVSWLEETAAEELDEEEREYRGISSFFWPEEGVWRATHHELQRSMAATANGVPTLATELDPDGPNRQERSLERGDEEGEARIAHALWRLLRAGRCESARLLSDHVGQHWRSLALGGALRWSFASVGVNAKDDAKREVEDPHFAREQLASELIGWDTTQRLMWKWSLSKAASSASAKGGGNAREVALYGILAGDFKSASHGCSKDWHSQLWTQARCFLDLWVDSVMMDSDPDEFQHRIVDGYEAEDNPVWPPQAVKDGKPDGLTDMLERIRSYQETVSERVRQHCSLQEHMILSKWDDLIQSLMNFVYVEGRDGDSQVDVYAIRFAANLLILASACVREETRLDTNRGDPSLSKSNLLKTYIWYLIDTEQYDLVPLYACHVHGAYVKYIYATLFELLVNEDFELKQRIVSNAYMYLPVKRNSSASVHSQLSLFFSDFLNSIDHWSRNYTAGLSDPTARRRALEWAATAVDNYDIAVSAGVHLVRDLALSNPQEAINMYNELVIPCEYFEANHKDRRSFQDLCSWGLYLHCVDMLQTWREQETESQKMNANKMHQQGAKEAGEGAVEKVIEMLESQDGWTVNDPLPEDPVSIELVMESVHSHPDLRQASAAQPQYAGEKHFWRLQFRGNAEQVVEQCAETLASENAVLVYSNCSCAAVGRLLARRCSIPPLLIQAAKAEASVSPGRGRIISKVADGRHELYKLFSRDQLHDLLMVEREAELNIIN